MTTVALHPLFESLISPTMGRLRANGRPVLEYGWISRPMTDAPSPRMSAVLAIDVAIRELQRRRRGIQRRAGANDPKWSDTMRELALATAALEALGPALAQLGRLLDS